MPLSSSDPAAFRMDRRGVLIGLAATASACANSPRVADSTRPLVEVESGVLTGIRTSRGDVFKGIPYAEPPVGPLRWKPPLRPLAWDGIRDATQFGPASPQGAPPGIADLTTVGGAPGPYSEDCLTLNVWAPTRIPDKRAPVVVWIHGGSFRMGAGSLPFYSGEAFARDGVVFVSINYRLGHFGYFAHPALTAEAGPTGLFGNFAVMDQIAALEWVQRNIQAFGGDPANVTIMGESAGGAHVLTLLAVPAARNLFHRAIVESGGGWSPNPPLQLAEFQGLRVAAAAGVPADTATPEALRAIATENLVDPAGTFAPFIDGRLITESLSVRLANGEFADVPLLIGANSGEGSLLNYGGRAEAFANSMPAERIAAARAVYPGLAGADLGAAMFGDAVFVGPARWVAEQASTGQPAYLYHFSYVEQARRAQWPLAPHGSEVAFVFETLDKPLEGPPVATPADWRMARTMHACWVAFIQTGRPHCPGGPEWPAYDPDTDALLEFAQDGPVVRQKFLKPQLDWQQRLAAPLWGGK